MKIENCKLKIKDIVLDILFPKVCINCSKEGKYICDKCSIFVSEAEPMIYTGECLDGLISVWDYEGLIKELIQMIKYQGITDAIKELMPEELPQDSSLRFRMTMPSIVTYVPMYLKKEKKRGFNQAELIARELAKKLETRSLSLLEKVVDTKDQTKLSKEERLKNVKDSFREVRPLENSNDEAVRGRTSIDSVLLVDDFFTTGATMRECCKVLKQSGIKKVWGFTLARTV